MLKHKEGRTTTTDSFMKERRRCRTVEVTSRRGTAMRRRRCEPPRSLFPQASRPRGLSGKLFCPRPLAKTDLSSPPCPATPAQFSPVHHKEIPLVQFTPPIVPVSCQLTSANIMLSLNYEEPLVTAHQARVVQSGIQTWFCVLFCVLAG